MNLPNKITVSRMVMILLMIITLAILSLVSILVPTFKVSNLGDADLNLVYFVMCILFIIASVTDFLDGYLARKNNQVTDLGKFLDPIADKLLVNSMLIFLIVVPSYINHPQMSIGVFFAVVLIARDLVVDGLRLVASKNNVVLAANMYGKIKTVLQMIAIVLILLNDYPFKLIPGYEKLGYFQIGYVVLYLATIMSVLSAVIYVYQNRKVIKTK